MCVSGIAHGKFNVKTLNFGLILFGKNSYKQMFLICLKIIANYSAMQNQRRKVGLPKNLAIIILSKLVSNSLSYTSPGGYCDFRIKQNTINMIPF